MQTNPDVHVHAEIRGRVGCLTLARHKALNALSLEAIHRTTTLVR